MGHKCYGEAMLIQAALVCAVRKVISCSREILIPVNGPLPDSLQIVQLTGQRKMLEMHPATDVFCNPPVLLPFSRALLITLQLAYHGLDQLPAAHGHRLEY